MFQLSPLVISPEILVAKGGIPDFHVAFRDLLHAVNLQHGTHGFTSPPKEGVLRIFFPLKNPTALARFEPANLGWMGWNIPSTPVVTAGKHDNTRGCTHSFISS
jgi:hypothetical protein